MGFVINDKDALRKNLSLVLSS